MADDEDQGEGLNLLSLFPVRGPLVPLGPPNDTWCT